MKRPVSPVEIRTRRLGFLAANLIIDVAMLALAAHAIGWSALSIVMLACFATFLPWSVLGFCNAIVGLSVLFGGRRTSAGQDNSPVTSRTAIVMTVRNEDPARAIRRLRIVQRSLDSTDFGQHFAFFLLSDTSDPAIAAREEAAIAAWRADTGQPDRLHYRRRSANTGFKAGNVMEFCQRWGDDYAFMLLLDADSLMSAAAILALVRIMQQNPRFGIVQSLVTGLPAASAFARIFQFGMRHGMRSYTVGQAWWTADCGPFWGHNAIVRIAPFRTHCALPLLSGRPILSHDQIEAVLMRRAGFDVRLQPVAGGSWEDNPPTILDYIRRDLRWCQGNLQYFRLVGLPGLQPVSRFQLIWAILMFVGLPAWTLLITLLPVAAWDFPTLPATDMTWLAAVYWLFLLMYLSPKLAGYLHTAARRDSRRRYGGLLRFSVGMACELVFSLLQASITSFHVTGFIAALLSGHSAGWGSQSRDARRLSCRDAAVALWPQTLFGLMLHGALLAVAPAVLPWALPFTLGYLLAIPFAVITAHPAVSAWCVRHGVCAVPEDLDPPPEVAALSR